MATPLVEIRIDPIVPICPRFRGVGFHDFSHLHPKPTPHVRQVFLDRWRQVNPSFARLTHTWTWDEPAAVEHMKMLRDVTGTEIYLTTWDPQDTSPGEDRDRYCRRVVDLLERLVRGHGLTNLRTYCMTNELTMNGWGLLRADMPKFADYHSRIAAELARRELKVDLLASDASPISYWDTIEWCAENLDHSTGVYGGHHYLNDSLPADPKMYDWLLEKMRWGVGLARARGKDFIVGEFGSAQHRGGRYGFERWDGCRHFDTPEEPLAALQVVDAVVAMINAGVSAIGYWTFADFPDDYSPTYANKWGLFRWSGDDLSQRPLYSALAPVTKCFRGPAVSVATHSSDPFVHCAAVARVGGHVSLMAVNRTTHAIEAQIHIPGLSGSVVRYDYAVTNAGEMPLKLLCPSARIALNENGSARMLIASHGAVVLTTGV